MAGEIEVRERSYWGLESKICDSCKTSPSILFCRADSAFLCATCDARVHSANKLASRHDRVWLCEVCEQAPAAVTCKADAAALCVTCDADIHSANPLARRHDRLPVLPFFDPITTDIKNHHHHIHDGVNEINNNNETFFLKKSDDFEEEVGLKSVDYFFSDVDPYLDFDSADSVVPQPPPQPSALDFDFTTYTASSLEVGVLPDSIGDVSTGYVSGRSGSQSAMRGMDREARVMRYREKRKNRRFEKTIRYASRKAYAETRPRIKGRFVKRTEVEAEVERMYTSVAAAGIVGDGGYWIVPSLR